jgi:surface carbohydrate biosynthesis protein
MRILLTYHNFLRDYRGALLLSEILKYQGHKVWIRAHWRNEIEYSKVKNVDVIIVGQIAESSTYQIAEFSKANNIRLIINQTENVVNIDNYEALFIYNNKELNEDHIDLQNIATSDVYDYMLKHESIKNKDKYVFTGFPRLDISIDSHFNRIEDPIFKRKYSLHNNKKVYLYISSFLFEDAFDGMTKEDFEAMGINAHLRKQELKVDKLKNILNKLIAFLNDQNGLLLIKRHPWDCSNFFEKEFTHGNVKILDRMEYIIPCIANSDVVIHEFSTTAIEAWLLKKKTFSLNLSDEVPNNSFNHLKYEVIASSFEELEHHLRHDCNNEERLHQSLELFRPHIDGKATIKFANAINRLKPHPDKVHFQVSFRTKLSLWVKDLMESYGFSKLPLTGMKVFSKIWDLTNWENDRYRVRKMYLKPIRRYIKKNKKFIE